MASAFRDAQRHQTLERARQVAELRVRGKKSYRQIGDELGLSHTHCQTLFQKFMEQETEAMTKEAGTLRTLELHRLDELWELNFERATDPREDPEIQARATTQCLRISNQRSKLLGLEAPVALEVSGPGGGPIQVDVTQYEGDALEKEVAGLFNPGYLQGAADGYRRGQEDATKAAEGAQADEQSKAQAKAHPPEKPKRKTKPKPDAPASAEGEARTGQGVTIAVPSQGRARV